MTATKIIQTFYISTGAKNAMYTLRCRRDVVGSPNLSPYTPDYYLKTLAADEDRAVEKAREHFEAFVERVGGNREDCTFNFEPYADNEVYQRRGKLSVADTKAIEEIEAGVFPFGKHKGEAIADAPEGYVLFFADKLATDMEARPVSLALYAACAGVALERGLIAKRDAARAERRSLDEQSEFVGTVGERREFTGTVVTQFYKGNDEGGYWINKVRCGNDLVCYVGKQFSERDCTITFKATIKKHSEYQGIKSTQVNRPVIL